MGARWVRTAVLLSITWLVAFPHPASADGSAPLVLERGGDLFSYRLGASPYRLTDTAAREHTPAWSPDRTRLAFAAWDRRLAVLDVPTGARQAIGRLPDRIDAIEAITWSPDGSTIAVAGTNEFLRDGSRYLSGTVWLVDVGGDRLRLILSGQGLMTGLSWRPDDRRLFASTEWPNGVDLWDPKAPLGIVSFAADGSDVRLVRDTLASGMDLSSDGRRIAYRSWLRTCHACGELWRMAADGSGAHVVAMPPESVYGLYEPRFSPAGTRIALLASARHLSLWLMRADGSRLHRVLGSVDGIDW